MSRPYSCLRVRPDIFSRETVQHRGSSHSALYGSLLRDPARLFILPFDRAPEIPDIEPAVHDRLIDVPQLCQRKSGRIFQKAEGQVRIVDLAPHSQYGGPDDHFVVKSQICPVDLLPVRPCQLKLAALIRECAFGACVNALSRNTIDREQ